MFSLRSTFLRFCQLNYDFQRFDFDEIFRYRSHFGKHLSRWLWEKFHTSSHSIHVFGPWACNFVSFSLYLWGFISNYWWEVILVFDCVYVYGIWLEHFFLAFSDICTNKVCELFFVYEIHYIKHQNLESPRLRALGPKRWIKRDLASS